MELALQYPNIQSGQDFLLISSVHVLEATVLIIEFQEVFQTQLWDQLGAKVFIVLKVRLETRF